MSGVTGWKSIQNFGQCVNVNKMAIVQEMYEEKGYPVGHGAVLDGIPPAPQNFRRFIIPFGYLIYLEAVFKVPVSGSMSESHAQRLFYECIDWRSGQKFRSEAKHSSICALQPETDRCAYFYPSGYSIPARAEPAHSCGYDQ
jgi:hypothetical protein